jgi:diaminohydroxyphosphoribosylaminopyrimidine deaminase/5-amino-6-(5-phosphoribosylamino)uracil reductase
VLVSSDGPGAAVIGAAFQRAQGTTAAEELAALAAGPLARGSTAYLNLESGSDCVGDDAAVRALVGAGVARVVVGLRHPLPHLRGRAVAALRRAGVRVDVLGETPVHPALEEEARRELLWYQQQALLQQRQRSGGGGAAASSDALAAQVAAAEAAAQREAAVAAALAAGPGRPAPTELLLAAAGAAAGAAAATPAAEPPPPPPLLLTPPDPDAPTPRAALLACLRANEALVHRAVTGAPFSVLKYAMTLDGKIAASSGHSAWVSSPAARAVVFEVRARSDAVVVGGNTVRRDDPRLTTRRLGGHSPARVVMSRTLDLPEKAALWDVALAPTIVMTQRGARPDAQRALRARGVEVVEFDFLHPRDVARYCAERGFLQVLWECGGKLAAPAIAAGVVHKVVSFVAPKIVGGERAPTPVGELGNVQMTQASPLCDVTWRTVGPDLMATGYMPSSGGLLALEAALSRPGRKRAAAAAAAEAAEEAEAAAVAAAAVVSGGAVAQSSSPLVAPPLRNLPGTQRVITFYKSWDEWGALSNFSPHPVEIGEGAQEGEDEGEGAGAAVAAAAAAAANPTSTKTRLWPSVEHYYQSQKFAATPQHTPSAEAEELSRAIAAAPSPEEAARLGRRAERERPELVRPDWPRAKRGVMLRALRAKFRAHAGPKGVLLSTAGAELAAGAGVAGALRTVEEEEDEEGARGGVGGGGGGALLLEASPHDRYWGQGFDGTGSNALGELLMKVREELLREEEEQQGGQRPSSQQQHHHHANGSLSPPSGAAASSPTRPQAAATR